jgi:hypothetical protein
MRGQAYPGQRLFVAADSQPCNPGTHAYPERQPRLALTVAGPPIVKAKLFEAMLHKLPSGKSPASELEDLLNSFLAQFPALRVVAPHMNTVFAPAEPNAMPGSDESTIIIFSTLFYTAHETKKTNSETLRRETTFDGIRAEGFRAALSPAV